MLGNDAVAIGLMRSGLRAAFAYPGTPSSEILQRLAELAGGTPVYVEWSVNEKVAYENALGASFAGRRSCAIMKHVGLNVASDAFMTSAYTGVSGGLVLVVADDPFAHSSQNEQDSRRYAAFAGVPCLEPASPAEAMEMAGAAFELSERFRIPVMLRLVTRLSHGKADVDTGDVRPSSFPDTGFVKDPARYVMVPSNARAAVAHLREKQGPLSEALENSAWNAIEGRTGSGQAVVASGLCWQYAREFRERSGQDFLLVKIGTYPLPGNMLTDVIRACRKLLVLEEVDPVIEESLCRIARTSNPSVEIHGKLDGYLPQGGELSVEDAAAAFGRMEGTVSKQRTSPPPLPGRPPVLCAGCPHTASFYILKKAFGKDAVFPGDIGCYTLGVRLGALDTCVCMGSGIGIGSGISRVEKGRNVVAIIGDSTFFHAGIPALVNAAYNRSDVVVAILDNRTTAMTGHQPHPGTGVTASGERTVEIDLEALVRGCGVQQVMTVNPLDIRECLSALKPLQKAQGVRVVIFRAPCLLLEERREGKRLTVDSSLCKGCGACAALGCSAIVLEGKKVRITGMCNGCEACVGICPVHAIRSG